MVTNFFFANFAFMFQELTFYAQLINMEAGLEKFDTESKFWLKSGRIFSSYCSWRTVTVKMKLLIILGFCLIAASAVSKHIQVLFLYAYVYKNAYSIQLYNIYTYELLY